MRSKFLALATIVLLFVSCNKEEPIPSYIHIDKIDLTTNYANEGSSSHKIVDAWIYIDDQLVGAFEMPCTVPVLTEGNHTIKVLPGIKENGISDTRIQYPFYNRYEQSITLTKGQITTVSPSITYAQSADFAWIEDFEGTKPSICDSTKSDTAMQIVSSPVFEKTGSGGVFLVTNNSFYSGTTCNTYVLPKSLAPVFLELNYYCNTDFKIGITAYDASNIITGQEISLTIKANSGWNKIYVNLSSEVSNSTNASKFGVFFSMVKDPIQSLSYFYVDNVKLVY